MKDRAIASVQVAWHSTAVGRPISVFAVDPGPCEGHKTSVTTISAKIPTISWDRAEPTSDHEEMQIDVRVGLVGYYRGASIMRFPMPLHRHRKIKVNVSRL